MWFPSICQSSKSTVEGLLKIHSELVLCRGKKNPPIPDASEISNNADNMIEEYNMIEAYNVNPFRKVSVVCVCVCL